MGGPAFEIAGRYEYDHGDLLRYRCGRHRFCSLVMVRDGRIERLTPGQHIRVVGRREACVPGGAIRTACLFSSDRSVFVVDRWLQPAE
ncbi:hypothetical protein GVN21_17925 [Caulobacter sp. SLTY]|uniref:hypothetical protein n=1 Tax=Caulobacter sp. SLTY TaxID=2683262 RepID=UPI00141215BB|nr:hypothetical protein [Caulobacter sp. SLTY]NBB17244.1 hypothetical protein [Caulobacter sp. SLTY]